MSARALGGPWRAVAQSAQSQTYWEGPRRHSVSIPTQEELDVILDAAKRVGADRFHFGLAGAALHALALRRHRKDLVVTADDSMKVTMSFIEKNEPCAKPETALLVVVGLTTDRMDDFARLLCESEWAGVLLLGERWATGNGVSKEIPLYDFLGRIGWMSVRRTLAATVSYHDIRPGYKDLVAEAVRLSGCVPPCRHVQELFVPTKEADKMEFSDPEGFHKQWYEHAAELDALSLASRLRELGPGALVPDDPNAIAKVLTNLDKKTEAYRLLMGEVSRRTYRVLGVAAALERLPYTALTPELLALRFPADRFWGMDARGTLVNAYLDEWRKANQGDPKSPKLLPVCRVCTGVEASKPSQCAKCGVPLCSHKCVVLHHELSH